MFHLLLSVALATEPSSLPLTQPEPVIMIDPLTPTQKVALWGYGIGFSAGLGLTAASLIPYDRATRLQHELEDPLGNFRSESEFNAARDKYGRNRTAFYAMLGAGLGLVVVSPLPIIISLETEKVTVSGRF